MGATRTSAVSRARRKMKSTIAASSITGWVLGITIMVVTPPAAAASEAVASVSRYSVPGSPVNTRMSIRPGMSVAPAQSKLAVPAPMESFVTFGPTASIQPSSTRMPPLAVQALGRSNDVGIQIGFALRRLLDGRRHHDFAPAGQLRDSASSTAMRTATPISTCSRITDCAPSATLESISMPRFIGPGCMTSASGLA